MEIEFTKMNGAGNDFVMIDNRGNRVQLSAGLIQALCDRRRGIGGMGCILIENESDADFRMRYYNSDGGEAEMCGNGARCAARFAVGLGIGQTAGGERRVEFMAQPGLFSARVDGERVAVSMTDATDYQKSVSLELAKGQEFVHFINTGVPHAVVVEPHVDQMSDDSLVERGRAIRMHPRFAPNGANANFVTVGSDGQARLRTYERGVEAETLACGTGAVATAVVLAQLGDAQAPVSIRTRGGELLTVSFDLTSSGARHVVLEGPAHENFHGSVDLSSTEGWTP